MKKSIKDKFLERKELLIDITILLIIEIYILSVLSPHLIFKDTIITGGDTASYYSLADYLKNELLPRWRLSGWDPGNFAGYPLFQFYFVIPFLAAVLLSYLIPLTISLKIITVLGVITLPLATYYSFRKFKYPFPVPSIAASLSLILIFHEGYTMFGGNLLSTFAGEFCYSISLSLLVLYMGSLYRGIKENRGPVKNGILLALIGLCHSFVFLMAGCLALYFLLKGEDFARNLKYLIRVNLLAFLLMGFWIIPLLSTLQYTTPFYLIWIFNNWKEIIPPTIIPFISLASLRVLLIPFVRSYVLPYFLFITLSAVLLYFNAHILNVPDIRFLPFILLMVLFITADTVFLLSQYIRPKAFFAMGLLFSILLYVNEFSSDVKHWVKWNYEGYEEKVQWSQFKAINSFLKGSIKDPRVAYEKSGKQNRFGSDRVFESLPFFSGRQTLEGVHFASSLSSKPVLFLQSEFSEAIMAPVSYILSRMNLDLLLRHLSLFNISHIIAVSEKTREMLGGSQDFRKVFTSGEYSIFEFNSGPRTYVEALGVEPIVYTGKNWRGAFYKAFKSTKTVDLPLVPKSFLSKKDMDRFKIFISDVNSLDKVNPLPIENRLEKGKDLPCDIKESIDPFRIRFETSCIGVPHMIKFSYFPNWKVSGAREIYPVSPSFMLVIPEKKEVILKYGWTRADLLGIVLTLLGMGWVLGSLLWSVYKPQTTFNIQPAINQGMDKIIFSLQELRPYGLVLMLMLLIFSTAYCLKNRNLPVKAYRKGMSFYSQAKYNRAIQEFDKIKVDLDKVDVVLSLLFKGRSFVALKEYEKGLKVFQQIIDQYPYSRYTTEAYYEIGLIHLSLTQRAIARKNFQKAVALDKYSPYYANARARLAELEEK